MIKKLAFHIDLVRILGTNPFGERRRDEFTYGDINRDIILIRIMQKQLVR